jgi:hypothetical protein
MRVQIHPTPHTEPHHALDVCLYAQNVLFDPDLNAGLRTEISRVLTRDQVPLREIGLLRSVSDECIARVRDQMNPFSSV